MSALRLAFRAVARPQATRLVAPRLPVMNSLRTYSAAAGLSRDAIQARVLDVFKGFEKVDQNKLTPSASFSEDLGLDSLDAVEVVMAVEEEFSIEIPDAEADEIKTVSQAVEYIANTPEAK